MTSSFDKDQKERTICWIYGIKFNKKANLNNKIQCKVDKN